MITLEKHDATTLKISHVMSKSKSSKMAAYLFIPGELGVNSDVLPEQEFYYNYIEQKRAYYSDQYLLPLVHSRLAKRGRLSSHQYRVSLSLFAYQYAVALEKSIRQLMNKSDSITPEEVTSDEVDTVIELTIDILRQLRRSVPYEENQKRYYTNIDNYLSWYTEQSFLKLIAKLDRNHTDYKTLRDRLITLAEKEQAHRQLHRYNSSKVNQDITRLSNKMRLLRRLIEYPVILKEEIHALGNNIQRAVKGIATGLVMIFVTALVILARDYLGEITFSFLMVMSLIYALREIFKDDLREALWQWLRKGKAKWKRRYIDPNTNTVVGQKLEWLDYQSLLTLPERIQQIRKKRIVQREEQVLCYRSEVSMSTSRFMSGYEETREAIYLDFRGIMRLFDRNTNKVYQLHKGQVSRESVEKRHLFNMIIREDNFIDPPQYYRWKLILNRNKIVDIESIPLKKHNQPPSYKATN